MANEKEKTELKKNEGSQYMLWTEVKNYKVLAYIYVYIPNSKAIIIMCFGWKVFIVILQ